MRKFILGVSLTLCLCLTLTTPMFAVEDVDVNTENQSTVFEEIHIEQPKKKGFFNKFKKEKQENQISQEDTDYKNQDVAQQTESEQATTVKKKSFWSNFYVAPVKHSDEGLSVDNSDKKEGLPPALKKEEQQISENVQNQENSEKVVKAKKTHFWQKWKFKNKNTEEEIIPENSDNQTQNNENPSVQNTQQEVLDKMKSLSNKPKSSLYIKEVVFEGNNLVKTSDISTVLNVPTGSVYDRDVVQQGLKQVYQMGYFTDKLKAEPIQIDNKNIVLKVTVEENRPITGFTIEGNEMLSIGEISEVIEAIKGYPQNMQLISSTVAKLEDLYASKGYILARVTAISDDPDGMINIIIAEGHINSITIQGNAKTKDFVVERNILSKPGEVYNENQIKADLTRLYATQAFKDVNRSIQKVDLEDDLYDITIELEEQRTASVSLGGGLDTATGLFGTIGFADNNFRGAGQRIGLSLLGGTGVILNDNSMIDRANWQGELSFFEPRLKGSDNSLLAKVFYRDFASYQIPLAIERRYGFETTLSHPIKQYKNLSGQFSLGIEQVSVKEGDEYRISNLYKQHNIPISERANQLKSGLFFGLTPGLVYDTRDNFANPRNGVLANVRFTENLGVTDFSSTHGKLSGSLKKYFPVGKKSSFSLTAKAAGKVHGDMPEVMAYRLGGPYTIRGFRMSDVGTGDGFMMASAEILTPLLFLDRIERLKFLNNVRLAFFTDAGKLFNTSISDRLYNRPGQAISAGVGLRLFIPNVGPLSVDWGYPLTNVGDGNRRGAFTFGVGEFY